MPSVPRRWGEQAAAATADATRKRWQRAAQAIASVLRWVRPASSACSPGTAGIGHAIVLTTPREVVVLAALAAERSPGLASPYSLLAAGGAAHDADSPGRRHGRSARSWRPRRDRPSGVLPHQADGHHQAVAADLGHQSWPSLSAGAATGSRGCGGLGWNACGQGRPSRAAPGIAQHAEQHRERLGQRHRRAHPLHQVGAAARRSCFPG